MTWQQISDEINRKLVLAASPYVPATEMVGLLNETYDELINEWFTLLYEKDEMAIQLLAPLKQGSITVTLTSTIFYIDSSLFPGGLRWLSALRGNFVQDCNGVAESRNVEFMSDNDLSDLENPLRMPNNDHPKYRIWFDVSAQKKKVTIYCGTTVPATLNAMYYRNPVVLSTITGSPEISVEGHYSIVKRAVSKQSGTDQDQRQPYFKNETDRDLQVKVTS